MTPKQLQFLEAVGRFVERKKYAPSYDELARAVGVSKSGVHRYVVVLARGGYLTHRPACARTLELTELGRQRCGFAAR